MFAIHLLRQGRRVTLIERRQQAGPGLAYGSAHETHLLNVRAGNMSAFPDEPSHFADWLSRRGVIDAASVFAPRVIYGEYLRELLDDAGANAGGPF
ncbi:MAG: FAD/NAD(P)-binding protein, partial [Acetobacteraceae bacterium]|nr:FAD/NAD(P)-binding protein [Acetobacteraceae bacterium]